MNLAERLIEAVQKDRKRIVVIGDAMVDKWIHGRVEGFQDGCPKFVRERVVTTPGGAANALNCLHHWGTDAELFAVPERERCIKTRYVADGKVVFRSDMDVITTRPQLATALRDVITTRPQLATALRVVSEADAVLLSDYDKGFLPPWYIREVAAVCRKLEIPCVADCKCELEAYVGCILKGNAAWAHRSKVNLLTSNMVVTYGPAPPVVNGRSLLPALPSVSCVNHVGAGDCFAAHLTLALAYGFSLREAAMLAYSAGRVYVQHPHNRPPHPEEIAVDLSTVS